MAKKTATLEAEAEAPPIRDLIASLGSKADLLVIKILEQIIDRLEALESSK